MGDSFRLGHGADLGKSYLENLEATLPATEIWNLAIGGADTVQDLQACNDVAPILSPHLSILGVTLNASGDYLNVNFHGIQLRHSDGNLHILPYPWKDQWGNPLQLAQELVLPYAILGYRPPANSLEALVGTTRLGALALRVLDRVAGLFFDRSFEAQVETSRDYLAQLRAAALALHSGALTDCDHVTRP